ncbi:MAG: type II secretion system protein N [Sulfuricaulis sp.]
MKKSRWLPYAIFGLVFYLLFLIIEMPASWFAWGLNRYTQGAVRLDPIAGSLWSGNGRLVVYYPQTTPHDFGQTEWGVNPFWLFAGRVQLSLQANHQDKRLKTSLGLGHNSFLLKDTEAELPAAFVAQLYTPLSLISPQGKVRITAESLALSPGKVEGAATLEWLNAGSSLSSVQPLGDYRLDITGAEKNANLKLTTLRGDLEFTGQGQWQPQTGQVQINGTALPRARTGELESLLNMIGSDHGSGRRSLNINVRLPPIFPPN